MKLGIEALRELEQLAAEQRRIYDDACDIGLPADDKTRQVIRRVCRAAMDELGHDLCAVTRGPRAAELALTFPFEIDDGYERGALVRVREEYDRRAPHFSIDIRPYSRPVGRKAVRA